MALIFGAYAVRVSLASWWKDKNESQQSFGDKKQQIILNMIKTLNFMFLFEW